MNALILPSVVMVTRLWNDSGKCSPLKHGVCSLMAFPGLQACVLSGGASERMGRDKALLPHPRGGVWLTALVDQLIAVPLPVLVVSRHGEHSRLLQGRPQVDVMVEPPPFGGPLRALAKVLHPGGGHPLLVAPVDMPMLSSAVLQQLIHAWQQDPHCAAVAHDGQRLQPLLGIYPSGVPFTPSLHQQLGEGNRRWLSWLAQIPYQSIRLPEPALRNVNAPCDLAALRA